jgi:hypothetical protein
MKSSTSAAVATATALGKYRRRQTAKSNKRDDSEENL